METKIAIIDMDSVLFSIGQGLKVVDKNNEPIKIDNKFVYIEKTEKELIEASDFWMNKILIDSGSTHYIAYIKGTKTISSRKEINSSYKETRPKFSPWYWYFVKEYLVLKWKVILVNDMEVDDAVNITRLQIKNSFIVAIDNDLLCLEGKHYNWRKSEWITTTTEQAHYKFWFDMICGQSGDNIKGIEGVGKVGATKILEDSTFPSARVLKYYIEKYGEETGIENFYKNYKCLKILDKCVNFEFPDPILYIPLIEVVKDENDF